MSEAVLEVAPPAGAQAPEVPDGPTQAQIDSIFVAEPGEKMAAEGQDASAEVPPPPDEKPGPEAAAKPELTPREQRAAAILANAKRNEMRIAQEREKMRVERAQAARKDAELKEAQERYTKLKSTVDRIGTEPHAALTELGHQTPELLRRVIAEGTPEAAARAEAELVRREAAEARAEVKALREKLEAESNQRAEAEQAARLTSAVNVFVDHVAKNADNYPHLVEAYTPEEIGQKGVELVRAYGRTYLQKTGYVLDDDVIAKHLEKVAAERAAKHSEWRQKVRGGSSSQGQRENASGSGGQTVRPGTPRTLTNGQASMKASPSKAWTQDDADAASLQILEKALRGG